MSYSIWHTAKHRASTRYQPRLATDTPLYRLVYEFREQFEYRWEELFEHQYGTLRQVVLDAMDAYLNCGVFAHGCARVCCESCNHSELIAFSCKRRCLCPSCDAKRGYIFAEQLQNTVLPPLPLRHIVWTIPKRIRAYFRYRKLYPLLYRAASDTWNEYNSQVSPKATSGAVIALHSAGSLINHHPHLHGIHLDGSINDSGNFQQFPEINHQELESIFADNLLTSLYREGVLPLEVIENIASWQHSGFSVHVGETIEPEDEQHRLFLARYLVKCPVSLKRIQIIEDPLKTTIRYFRTDDDPTDFKDFSPLQFLAEMQQHIPNVWEAAS